MPYAINPVQPEPVTTPIGGGGSPSWFSTLMHNPQGAIGNWLHEHVASYIPAEQNPNAPTLGNEALGALNQYVYQPITRAGTTALLVGNPSYAHPGDLGQAWKDAATTNVGQAFAARPEIAQAVGTGWGGLIRAPWQAPSKHVYGNVPADQFGGVDPTDPKVRATAERDETFNLFTAAANTTYTYFADPLVIGGKVAKPLIALERGRQLATPERLAAEAEQRSVLSAKIKAGEATPDNLSGREAGWLHLYDNRTNVPYMLAWMGGRHSGVHQEMTLVNALAGAKDFDEFSTVFSAARGDPVANLRLADMYPSIADALENADHTVAYLKAAQQEIPREVTGWHPLYPTGVNVLSPQYVQAEADLAQATRVADDAAKRSDWWNRMFGDAEPGTPKLFNALRDNQLVSPSTFVNTRRVDQAINQTAGWAGKHWADQVISPIGGAGRVVHVMGWAGRDAPPGIVATSGALGEDSWRQVRDLLKGARMPDDVTADWVQRYVAAPTPNTRQSVLVQMEQDVSRRIFAEYAPDTSKDTLKAMEDHADRFFAKYQSDRNAAMKDYRQHGWVHDVDEGRSTKLAPYEDLEAQNVPMMDFQMLRQSLSEFDQPALHAMVLSGRDVALNATVAFSALWKAGVLLRVGAIPRNLGESWLASWVYTHHFLQGNPIVGAALGVGNLYRRAEAAYRANAWDPALRMTAKQAHDMIDDRLGILIRGQQAKHQMLTELLTDIRDKGAADYYAAVPAHGSAVEHEVVQRQIAAQSLPGVKGGQKLLNATEAAEYQRLAALMETRALKRGERANLLTLHAKATRRHLATRKGEDVVVRRNGVFTKVARKDLTDADLTAPDAARSMGNLPAQMGEPAVYTVPKYKQAMADIMSPAEEARFVPGSIQPDWVSIYGDAARQDADRLAAAIRRDDQLIDATRENLRVFDEGYLSPTHKRTAGERDLSASGRSSNPADLHPNLTPYISGGIGHIETDPGTGAILPKADRSVVGYVRTSTLAKMPGNETSVEGVARYREALRSGEGFRNPIMVDWDPVTKKARVAEGNHRVAAAQAEGVEYVPVRVTKSRVPEETHGPTLTFDPTNTFERGGRGEEYWPPTMHPAHLFPPEDLYRPGARTYTAPGPRGDAAVRAVVERTLSARGKNELNYSVMEGQRAASRRWGRRYSLVNGSYKTYDPTDPMYYAASAEVANRQVRNSELAMRLLRTDDPEGTARWLMDNKQGQGLLRRINLDKTYDDAVTEWVYRAHYNLFRAYPNEALRNDVLRGEVTEHQVRSYLHGRDDLVPTIAREYTPSMRTTRWDDAFDSFIDRAFHFLWSLPEDKLARYPLYDRLYRSEWQRVVNQNQGFLSTLSERDANRWITENADTSARTYAVRTTQRVVYSSERRNNIAEKLRFVSPFMQVTGNRFYYYGTQALENPDQIARMFLGWNAIPTTTNDQGTQVVSLHLPGPVAKAFGLEALPTQTFQKSALNLVQNGEPWWSPGFGPVVTVPAAQVLRNNADSPIAKYMTSLLGKAGVFPQGYLGQSAWDQLLPTWGRRFLAGNGQQGANTASMLMAIENWRYEQHLRDTPPTLKEINERNDQLWAFRVIAAFVSPVQTQPSNDMVQHYTDIHRQYVKDYGKDAEARFLTDYPEYYDIVLSYTQNPTGIAPTQSASALESKNGYLIDSLPAPEMGGLVTNVPGQDGQFDQAAYYWQMNRPLAPGSETTIRSGADGTVSPLEQRLVSKGWLMYRDAAKQRDALLLQAKIAGGSGSIRAASNTWIRVLFDDAKKNIEAQTRIARPDGTGYSPWGLDLMQQDNARYAKRADSLRLIVKDPASGKNPAVSGWLDSAQQYLDLRAHISDLLAQQSSPSITAQSNAWLRVLWEDGKTQLAQANPLWAEVDARYFTNDDLSNIPGAEADTGG